MSGMSLEEIDRLRITQQVERVGEVRRGENPIAFINHPRTGRITEVTQSNVWAAEALLAHAYVAKYPELFKGVDVEGLPVPTQSELDDSTGYPAFGSIHDYEQYG